MEAAIETHRHALKRVLALLGAMAGLAMAATPAADWRPPVLPRHLYRALLRLLCPAESAARRLIILAARGMVAPPPRPRKPRPAATEPVLRRLGIAIVASPTGFSGADARKRTAALRAVHRLRLPLLDPARRLASTGRRPPVPPHAAPRILSFDGAAPHPLPPPPSPDDPIRAGRLGLRLAALFAALDDLPGEAMRFARWKARNAAALQRWQEGSGAEMPRRRRLWPLRCGRPPGALPSRPGPAGTGPQYPREIDAILAETHALALAALERRDSS